jgi:hypothetical protein
MEYNVMLPSHFIAIFIIQVCYQMHVWFFFMNNFSQGYAEEFIYGLKLTAIAIYSDKMDLHQTIAVAF